MIKWYDPLLSINICAYTLLLLLKLNIYLHVFDRRTAHEAPRSLMQLGAYHSELFCCCVFVAIISIK